MLAVSPFDDISSADPAGSAEPNAAAAPFLLPLWPLWTLLAVSLAAGLYAGFGLATLPDVSRVSTPLLGLLALIVAILVLPRTPQIGLAGSMLPFVIAWRVGAMHGSLPIMASSGVTAVYFVALYLDHMIGDWRRAAHWSLRLEWQMTTLRLYFGFDMIGHFAEKLFAGSASFTHMAGQFESFGLPNGALFVLLGGLCELGVAIGIGMGFLTRLAGVGGALYFMIANHFGGHFANGFTWSNGPDGGWEYPLLMALFYLSFALSGAGRFSVDGWLIAKGLMPHWARPFAIALPVPEQRP